MHCSQYCSLILVQHSVGISYRPQMKVVTFSGIRRQTSLPNRLDTACIREWGWELGLQNPSWGSVVFYSIQRHQEPPHCLLNKNHCIDTKYSIHSVLMNEQCISMQPLAPAWVSAAPLWDHQTFHINCQWSCQKIYAQLRNAGNSGIWRNVWGIFVGLDLKQ